MPIQSLDMIREGQQFPPHSEIATGNYVAKWRRLYEGDFTGQGIEDIAEGQPGIKTNWYRRVATFYGEFMFGDRPQILLNAINDRASDTLDELAANLFPQLQAANVDMIRYGLGVIASKPNNPMEFMRFERDHHFVVENMRGEITADVLYKVRNVDLPEEEKAAFERLVDVYKYETNGNAVWEIYNWTKGGLGRRLETIQLPPRQGRQVITFGANSDTTSLFEDIEGPIAEMSRTLSRVGGSIKRNLRPHLAVPAGAIITEDGRNIAINEKGMVFPLEAGDPSPEYLQWDNNLEATSWYVNNLRSTMFNMVGLSDLLFDASLFPGELSGEALRRLLMAFWSKLNHFKAINNTAIEQILDVWNNNRQVNGGEVFDIGTIDIMWRWEELFMSVLETDQDNDQERERETGGA